MNRGIKNHENTELRFLFCPPLATTPPPPQAERGRRWRVPPTPAGPTPPSPNTLVNQRLLDFITRPPPPPQPVTPRSDTEHFLLSLVPQMERLPDRTKARAKIAILQVLEEMESALPASNGVRPVPPPFPPHPLFNYQGVPHPLPPPPYHFPMEANDDMAPLPPHYTQL